MKLEIDLIASPIPFVDENRTAFLIKDDKGNGKVFVNDSAEWKLLRRILRHFDKPAMDGIDEIQVEGTCTTCSKHYQMNVAVRKVSEKMEYCSHE